MTIELSHTGTFTTGIFDEGAAEIVAHDPTTQRLFVVNGADQTIDVLDIADPANPVRIKQIFASNVTSVAVANGVLAAAIPDGDGNENGRVVLFDADGSFLKSVVVGALPDSLTFTPDGLKILVANEGEPTPTGDPKGSVSIIDLSGGVATATATTIDFTAFDGKEAALRAEGVRIFPDKSASQDFEPEYVSVSPDGKTAFVTLQEANSFAVIDIATAKIVDIVALGAKDHSQGLPTLTTYDLTPELPDLGVTAPSAAFPQGQTIKLGGMSGLWYGGETQDGKLIFYTLPDRGPNPEPTNVDADAALERPFALPDYQARVIRFTLDRDSGAIEIDDPILLTREEGGIQVPITGLPNIAGKDEEPVDLNGDPLPYDPFGGDLEGVAVDSSGNFWMVDEYRPAIYQFSPDGVLINRFVPEGTAALAGEAPGAFGSETLPAEFAARRPNRGFEAVALDEENGVVYAFIQSPLANPNTATSNASNVIRIIGVDMATGEPVSEYVYLLDRPSIQTDPVDKIGDAVYASDGQMYVIERDASVGPNSEKFVYKIDLKGATNLLSDDAPALPAGRTLESLTPDELADLGIAAANKVKVVNLPSLGYVAGDKAEGLALLPDGTLAVLNDNDFSVQPVPIRGDGTVDLTPQTNKVVLGLIEFGEGNGLDASDRDGGINIANWPVYGLYQPDGIASFTIAGRTYYITANEGDTRGEVERVKDLTLDPDAFPNAAELQKDENLGRLEVSTIDGDIDGDGDFDQLFVPGGRSFSIWDDKGNRVFDSGDQIEQIIAQTLPDVFNSSNDDNTSTDTRSDAKGPEPEGVTVGQIGPDTYAFIGLERIGGVLVYNINNPAAPEFIQYINPRDFSADAEDVAAGDLGPEGLVFISAEDSPTGKPLLAVANEVSGSTTIYTIDIALKIGEIQGEGHRSEYDDLQVKTSGIVTAVVSNGFFMQDSGDGNDETSDGLFVFTGAAPTVAIGDSVRVAGTVEEFIPGGATSGNLTTTEIISPTVEIVSSGNALPTTTVVGQGGRVLPTQNIDDDNLASYDPATDAIDLWESLEGMRVQVNNAVVVGPTTSNGEIAVLADGGAGADLRSDRGGIVVRENDFNPERIIIDDRIVTAEPQVGAGQSFTAPITGVVDYSFGNFKIINTAPLPTVTGTVPTPEVTNLVGNKDQLTVATLNVENLDPSDGDPEPDAVPDRLDKLASIVVNNLKAPDILTVEEIQDNSGQTDNGIVDASQTYAELIQAIAAAGGPTYEFRQIDPENNQDGGAPGGNIRVGFLYNPARVSFVDKPGATSANEVSVVADANGDPELSFSPGRIQDPSYVAGSSPGFEGTRKPLVGEFMFNGEKVFVIANHLKSKTGDDPLFGEEQPPTQNTLAQRIEQAEAIREFVDQILAIDPDANVVVLGDLNDFEFSQTLETLTEGGALEDLVNDLPQSDRYTFNFDGNGQTLDHILVSEGLNQGQSAQVDIVHVNTDLPDSQRASDHDSIVARVHIEADRPGDLRAATFNASLNRNAEGQLVADLSTPDNAQAKNVAEIIQRVAPDVLLINEFDYVAADTDGDGITDAADLFLQNYLGKSQNGVAPIDYQYVFVAPSNTGIASGFDLNNNGTAVTTPGAPGYGDDALGFGNFEGQFGMAFFSNYEILTDQVRTFQTFLWKDMPGALLPDDVNTATPNDFYSAAELEVLRLASKSFWDIPINVDGEVVHILMGHPTPPVFDGPEDRNGLRNHDEIRFFADYVTPGEGDYIYDDNGDVGGLAAGERFIILGDYNADPFDGDSVDLAINQLLDNSQIDSSFIPTSPGGVQQSALQGGANANHQGNPAQDTADFADGTPGNLRADYVLGSKSGLDQVGGEVFWPENTDPRFPLVGTFNPSLPGGFPSSDHRLVFGDFDIVEKDVVPTTFKLQILHASDLEGSIGAVEDAPNFAAIIDKLEDLEENSITISSGDNFIPSPFFNAGGDAAVQSALRSVYNQLFDFEPDAANNLRADAGRIDISIMNIIGFDTATFGNHEFDAGTSAISTIINPDIRDSNGDGTLDQIRWLGAEFPYLSTNLDFSVDPNLASRFTDLIQSNLAYVSDKNGDGKIETSELAAIQAGKKIAPAAIIEEGGEKIGVVGATTPVLESISSPGATQVKEPGAGTNDMAALASILQPVIDDLIAQGVNKIIVASHLQQIALEKELIGLLHGVDVIIAGGSNTLLADGTDTLRPGDVAADTYPLVTTNADGDDAVIVNTDGDYSYVGRLVLEFDSAGKIIADSIDEEVSGVYATTDEGVEAVWGNEDAFADGTKGDLVKELTMAVDTVIQAKDSNILGKTDVFLEGRRGEIRTEETNLGSLTADANLAAAKALDATVMVSIKNGGGVRDSIGTVVAVGGNSQELPPQANPGAGKEDGDISQLDIESALRFNNSLTMITVTAAQLLQVIEHAVSATAAGATPGQFPQIGGIEFSFDATLPAGNRVQSLALVDTEGNAVEIVAENGEVAGDAGRPIRLVTLNFLADGGDGYPFPSFVAANPSFANRVDMRGETTVDSNLNGVIDAPVAIAPGDASFALAGTEQDALAEYLLDNYADTPFNETDTAPAGDERIQNLAFREDAVFEGLEPDGLTLIGTHRRDHLDGGDGADFIDGRSGNDDLTGGKGADEILGGFGNDDIDGGDGDDDIDGGFGDDDIEGDAGNDEIDAGFGNDDVDGGAGNDTIAAGAGRDDVHGGSGDDEIDGSFGDDRLAGGDGNDVLRGGWDDDRLDGGAGNDELDGGFGRDRLIGGPGNDEMTGGHGADVFVITVGTGTDIVVDFGYGRDTLDLRAFDFANVNAVKAASTQEGEDLIIDLDGAAGDAEVVLLGTHANDLNHHNVAV